MLTILFPHLDGLVISAVRAVGSTVRIDAATVDEQVECPCGATPSRRVHSRYWRRLSDTAISGREVVIALRIRRLFCDNSDCGRRTFAEQVPGLPPVTHGGRFCWRSSCARSRWRWADGPVPG